MSQSKLLSENEINELLTTKQLWFRDGNVIYKEIAAASFVAAIGIVNSIAIVSEVLDHHPDILIYGWNKIRITISTHSQGGLTMLDFELAEKIDKLEF